MSRVIVVGSINQDVTVTVDRFPNPGETPPGTPPRGGRSGDPEGDLRVGDLRRGQVDDVAHALVLGQSFRKSVLQEGSIARGTDGDSHALSLSGLVTEGEYAPVNKSAGFP